MSQAGALVFWAEFFLLVATSMGAVSPVYSVPISLGLMVIGLVI